VTFGNCCSHVSLRIIEGSSHDGVIFCVYAFFLCTRLLRPCAEKVGAVTNSMPAGTADVLAPTIPGEAPLWTCSLVTATGETGEICCQVLAVGVPRRPLMITHDRSTVETCLGAGSLCTVVAVLSQSRRRPPPLGGDDGGVPGGLDLDSSEDPRKTSRGGCEMCAYQEASPLASTIGTNDQ